MPDGDHEVVAHEDVDLAGLDGVVLVDVPERLEHQEEAVVVVVQLRALVGVDGVLDRERVQAERLRHVAELGLGRLVEPHPHEVARVLRARPEPVVVVDLAVDGDPLPAVVERAVDDHVIQGRAQARSDRYCSRHGDGDPGQARQDDRQHLRRPRRPRRRGVAGRRRADPGGRGGGAPRRRTARGRREQPARALQADRRGRSSGRSRGSRPGSPTRASPSATTASGRAGPSRPWPRNRCGGPCRPSRPRPRSPAASR